MRTRTSAGLVLAAFSAAAAIVLTTEPAAVPGDLAHGQQVTTVVVGDGPAPWDCPLLSAVPPKDVL